MGWISRIASALKQPAAEAPGRNDPCWCGSGRKYKRCHLDADRLKLQARQRTCVSS